MCCLLGKMLAWYFLCFTCSNAAQLRWNKVHILLLSSWSGTTQNALDIDYQKNIDYQINNDNNNHNNNNNNMKT